jgi:hypothetical protein
VLRHLIHIGVIRQAGYVHAGVDLAAAAAAAAGAVGNGSRVNYSMLTVRRGHVQPLGAANAWAT